MSGKRRKMGKSRKRLAGRARTAKEALSRQTRPDEVFQKGGIRVERHGRHLVLQNLYSETQRVEMRKRLLEKARVFPTRAAEEVAELERRMANIDSFALIANMTLAGYFGFPSKKSSPAFKRPLVPEYIALLCLKGPYRKGAHAPVSLDDLTFIENKAVKILDDTFQYEMVKDLKGATAEEPTNLEKLAFLLKTSELEVRSPAYEQHFLVMLSFLFEPYDSTFREVLGFTIREAIWLAHAIIVLMPHKYNTAIDTAREHILELRQAVTDARKGKPPMGGMAAMLCEQLKELPLKVAQERAGHPVVLWLKHSAGAHLSLTSEELAHQVDLPSETARRFLDVFSIRFGEVPPHFCIPTPIHPLKEKPVISHEGLYLVPSPMLVHSAIQPLFEKTLKDAGLWHQYERHRHDVLLNEGIELLSQIMPQIHFEQELQYRPSVGNAEQGELDALGMLDNVVVLLEAKGEGMPARARRGMHDRLEEKLRSIIGESHAQALRAANYIATTDTPEFRREDGSTFCLDKKPLEKTMMVSLTLEPLGTLSAALHAKNDLGLFKEGSYPWIISIYDLMPLAELFKGQPSRFLHYVQWRILLAHDGLLEAGSEWDILGYYLSEGAKYLTVSGYPLQSHGRVQLDAEWTEKLDEYFEHLGRPGAPVIEKPFQVPKGQLRDLIVALEASPCHGWLDAALALWNMDDEGRQMIVENITATKKRMFYDGKLHDCSCIVSGRGGCGITYICSTDSEKVRAKLKDYCEHKSHELDSAEWYGLGDTGLNTFEISQIVRVFRSKLGALSFGNRLPAAGH